MRQKCINSTVCKVIEKLRGAKSWKGTTERRVSFIYWYWKSVTKESDIRATEWFVSVTRNNRKKPSLLRLTEFFMLFFSLTENFVQDVDQNCCKLSKLKWLEGMIKVQIFREWHKNLKKKSPNFFSNLLSKEVQITYWISVTF